MSKVYLYGMRLRGFAPMCQPMDGLMGRVTEPTCLPSERMRQYHDVLAYRRELSIDELDDYELDFLGSGVANDRRG